MYNFRGCAMFTHNAHPFGQGRCTDFGVALSACRICPVLVQLHKLRPISLHLVRFFQTLPRKWCIWVEFARLYVGLLGLDILFHMQKGQAFKDEGMVVGGMKLKDAVRFGQCIRPVFFYYVLAALLQHLPVNIRRHAEAQRKNTHRQRGSDLLC